MATRQYREVTQHSLTRDLLADKSLSPKEKLDRFLEENLSIRSANAIKSVYNGLEELITSSENNFLSRPNTGRRTLNELKEVLANEGFHLGMTLEISTEIPERNSVVEVAKRLDTAKDLLRDRNIQDPLGVVLAELLRQLSEKPIEN
jgi:hypothetical protein